MKYTNNTMVKNSKAGLVNMLNFVKEVRTQNPINKMDFVSYLTGASKYTEEVIRKQEVTLRALEEMLENFIIAKQQQKELSANENLIVLKINRKLEELF